MAGKDDDVGTIPRSRAEVRAKKGRKISQGAGQRLEWGDERKMMCDVLVGFG